MISRSPISGHLLLGDTAGHRPVDILQHDAWSPLSPPISLTIPPTRASSLAVPPYGQQSITTLNKVVGLALCFLASAAGLTKPAPLPSARTSAGLVQYICAIATTSPHVRSAIASLLASQKDVVLRSSHSGYSDRGLRLRGKRETLKLKVRVGRFVFRLDDVLGQGNFGTAYAGEEEATGRLVAIKLESCV